MTTANRVLLEIVSAALVGIAAAALVFWVLESSRSTTCFREAVEASVGEGPVILPDCDLPPFPEVREHIRAFGAEGSVEVEGRSALIVWITLFAGTAGFAGVSGVRSAFVIGDLKEEWDMRPAEILVGGLLGAAVVALPFLLVRSIAIELTPYNALHGPQLTWLPLFIGLMLVSAATALVLIWHAMSARADLQLDQAARLGARMRDLITMLGTVLALSVITTASRWQAIATLPGGEAVPSIVVLLWGALFAVFLAATYVPVHRRWAALTGRSISEEVRRQFSDYEGRGTVGFRPPELSAEKELRSTLGLVGPWKNLQGSIAILAPVIAAAISSLFS